MPEDIGENKDGSLDTGKAKGDTARRKLLASIDGYTLKQAEFLRSFKKWYPQFKADAPALRAVCDELGMKYPTASAYAYTQPKTAKAVAEFKQKLIEGASGEGYIVTAEWVMSQLTFVYDRQKNSDDAKETDIVDTLNSITNLLVKFNGKFDSDLKKVKEMSMPELVKRFCSTAGLVFDNERAGEMLANVFLKEGQYGTYATRGKKGEIPVGNQEVVNHKAEEIIAEARLAVDSAGDSEDSGDEETVEAQEQVRAD